MERRESLPKFERRILLLVLYQVRLNLCFETSSGSICPDSACDSVSISVSTIVDSEIVDSEMEPLGTVDWGSATE